MRNYGLPGFLLFLWALNVGYSQELTPFGGNYFPLNKTFYVDRLRISAHKEPPAFPGAEKPGTKTPMYYTLNPYLGSLSYSGNSTKKNGRVRGLYASLTRNTHFFEFGYEKISMRRFETLDIEQSSLVLSYTKYLKNFSLKGLYHGVGSNQTTADQVKVYYFQFSKMLSYRWGTNAAYAYSSYPNFEPEAATVNQAELDLFYIFPSSSWKLNIKNNFKTLLTAPSTSDTDVKNNYISYEWEILFYNLDYSLGLKKWFGRRNFSVINGGFTVYNLNEEYVGGHELAANFALMKYLTLSFKYSEQKFKETVTSDVSSVESFVWMVKSSF